MTTSFITTAIPYVNARPHLGFAYELVLADILARHRRRRGRDTRLQCGTDDHSLKNVAAAAREGISTRELVDRNSAAFADLRSVLDLTTDDFIRTSSDPRHRPAVEYLWRACAQRGDLYRRTWEGRYCVGCEAFVDDDVCREHDTVPELVREENWFFRLSRYRDAIREVITTNCLVVAPEAARNETLAFLDGEVRDICVSRDAVRASGWGIPVPDDPSQVIYIWFDALVNYVSALGFAGNETLFDRYWRAGERTHVIGKGIARFHAVYWPAFLLSAGLPLPDRIFVHAYLTVDGAKIKKSGVGFEIAPVVERFGVDALRWYFARKCRTRVDSDVVTSAIPEAHDTDLADRLGNLVQRVTALIAKRSGGKHTSTSGVVPATAAGGASSGVVPASGSGVVALAPSAWGVVPTPSDTVAARELIAFARDLPAKVDAALDAFAPDEATEAIVRVLDAANRYIEATAPWRSTDTTLLHAPLEVARIAAGEISPFVPGISATILARLGSLTPGEPLAHGAPPIPRRA